MARICPQCGARALDDQSQFCNKCGTPFPDDQPKKVVVRTMPRLADTPPPPVSPPAPDPWETAVPPAQPCAEPPMIPQPSPVRPKVRVPGKPPALVATPRSLMLPFKKFIARDSIKRVYLLGVIGIVLVALFGLTAGFTKSPIDTDNSTALATTPSFGGSVFTSPILWLAFLVFGNLFWRVICEMCVIQFALYEALASNGNTRYPDRGMDDALPDYGSNGSEEFVECPRCGKRVPVAELRSCDHCGVQGCSSCIRMSGLVRKTLTCKDCFEKK